MGIKLSDSSGSVSFFLAKSGSTLLCAMALPAARALGARAPRAPHCVPGLGHSVTIANACALGLCPLARRNGIPALPRVRCAPACASRVIPLRCALHPPFSPKGRVTTAELRNLQFKEKMMVKRCGAAALGSARAAPRLGGSRRGCSLLAWGWMRFNCGRGEVTVPSATAQAARAAWCPVTGHIRSP